ncbi:MAG: putative cell cycle control protein [Streblomastix strix]|uniref:Putative cell cycle control protein n=1 Tax=Streblomastix strix TaxID=222440 RepID=A0A5J4X292_9EUKA|nr:MAG: putative cell cycle control protein [Streblomastix strix]
MSENEKSEDVDSFTQQTLPGIHPRLQPLQLALLLGITCILFILLGIPLLVVSANLFEIVLRYDNAAEGDKIELNFQIDHDISGPVYVYYQLDDFYQNHRRFVISRDYGQLRGSNITQSQIETCDPRIKEGHKVDITIPCGIAANTFFNDTFEVQVEDQDGKFSAVVMKESGFVWGSDKSGYKDQPGQQINVTDDRFIAWMKPAAFSSFRKPYGILVDGLKEGNHRVVIGNNDKYTLGPRSFVLAKNAFFGGKNNGIGISYIVVGAVAGICALFIIGQQMLCPRTYSDAEIAEIKKGIVFAKDEDDDEEDDVEPTDGDNKSKAQV